MPVGVLYRIQYTISFMQKYDIELTEIAEKKLRKFNCEIQKHFFKKLEKLQIEPSVYGKPLRNVLQGTWELYFEHKYRILYSINENKRLVVIESILHKDDF